MNPRLVAYIHALIIDSISIPFDDSFNARALQHEDTMLGVYSKMKTDSFNLKSQLKAVLTTFYEDIKGVKTASGCTKSKTVKHRFQDADDARTTPDSETWIVVTAPVGVEIGATVST